MRHSGHRILGYIPTFCLVAVLGSSPLLAADPPEPRPELPGGMLDKPYLTKVGQGAILGGYMDMEFEWDDQGNTFDQHRFVPFITGHVSDRVTVSAEIEFEHGGNVDKDGEIKIEYAVMDFAFSEVLNFRGGVVLSPLGNFNLLHDSPLNDLTARPMVARQVIPTTLSESGMGFFGTMYPGQESVFSYQAFLVNGFNEGIIQPVRNDSGDVVDGKLLVRGGRGSQKADNNQDKSLVARAGFSPVLGSNLGLSIHTGKYDDAGTQKLTIGAVDAKATFGPFELVGEMALVGADIDRTKYPTAADSQLGYYAQGNYHFLHDTLLKGSVVTLAVRADYVDLNSDQPGATEEGFTVGLNFRPTEETVFKLDYAWAWLTPSGADKQDADNVFFFSFATYF